MNINFDKLQAVLSAAKTGSECAASSLKKIEFPSSKDVLGGLKASDMLAAIKLSEMAKAEEEKKKVNVILVVLGIFAGIAAIAAICYAVYCYFTPEYLSDFDDDFEDELDEDYFEDDEDDSAEK